MPLFQRIPLFLSVFSSLANVYASPTPQDVLLAQKYAPQFRFHIDEVYFPSTIEFFLAGPVSLYDANGPLAGAPSPLTDENLGDLTDQGNGTYITTDINANLNGFLQGQDPRNSSPTTYVFIAPKDNGIIDLYYWIFAPYNLGKKLTLLGYIGDHVGDWEYVAIRTVNGEPTAVDYHAHSDTGSGTIPWAQAPKFSPSSPNAPPNYTDPDPNARPVVYVAKGSHGMWSSVGTFTYVNAIVFKLQDETSDGGAYWDTQNSLTTIDYPDTYTGTLNWLNYKGEWGNEGINDCWWYAIHNECELVDGPPGPVRTEMSGNLQKRVASGTLLENFRVGALLTHTLATVSTSSSSYTFYADARTADIVAVEQVCTPTKSASSTGSTGLPYTSQAYASSQPGTARYTVTLSPCRTSSFVSSYSVGLCTQASQCSFGARRAIRAYSDDPAVMGPQKVDAVVVHDLDNWVF